MPFDQNNLPEWNVEGVEPPQSKKDSGWGPGEKPPADWFNWFFSKTYNALKSLFDNAQHKEEKGKPNGYASLGADGKVPSDQLSVSSPPDASLTTKGITQLNSATDSTDETTAATPKAVKAVNDVLESHQADTTAHVPYAVATGSANTYAVTLNPAPTAYTDGMAVSVKINVDATGASTLNLNGLGAKPIKKANGSDVTNLKANGVYTFRYNVSTGNFILQGEGGIEGLTADVIKVGVTLDGVTGTFTSDAVTEVTVGENDSGTYMLSSNFIQISLPYAADAISVTQSGHSLSYNSLNPDRYVIDGVTKYFSNEGGYVNNTGFKFLINGWAAANVNWTASKSAVTTYVPTTADKILQGSIAYANGVKLIGTGKGLTPPVAGDTSVVVSSSERNTVSTSYQKLKEIKWNGASGVIRTKFNLRSGMSGYEVYGRPAVNGVLTGTEHLQSSTSNISYADDISVNTGDLVQLFCRCANGGSGYVSDFSLNIGNPPATINLD